MTTEKHDDASALRLSGGLGVEYVGEVIEMGDLSDLARGLVVEIRPQIYLQIIGLARHDLKAMPNFLYKKVMVSIDVIDAA